MHLRFSMNMQWRRSRTIRGQRSQFLKSTSPSITEYLQVSSSNWQQEKKVLSLPLILMENYPVITRSLIKNQQMCHQSNRIKKLAANRRLKKRVWMYNHRCNLKLNQIKTNDSRCLRRLSLQAVFSNHLLRTRTMYSRSLLCKELRKRRSTRLQLSKNLKTRDNDITWS